MFTFTLNEQLSLPTLPTHRRRRSHSEAAPAAMVTVSGAALFLYAFAFTGATFLIMGFVDSCK